MRLVLLVIICSTLAAAIDDEKTTVKSAEKQNAAKDENTKSETVRIFSTNRCFNSENCVLIHTESKIR